MKRLQCCLDSEGYALILNGSKNFYFSWRLYIIKFSIFISTFILNSKTPTRHALVKMTYSQWLTQTCSLHSLWLCHKATKYNDTFRIIVSKLDFRGKNNHPKVKLSKNYDLIISHIVLGFLIILIFVVIVWSAPICQI